MARARSLGALRVVLAFAIAACRAVPTPVDVDPAAVGAARFPGAAAVLAGFDATEAGVDWRTGDRVLYVLTTESGTRVRAKLIEIELLGPWMLVAANDSTVKLSTTTTLNATVGSRKVAWSSLLLHVAVRVYETDGRLVQHADARVPETALRSGVHPAAELFPELLARSALSGVAPAVELSDREARVLAEAFTMLPTLLGILRDDGVLESLLMQVVGPPPLLSLLTGIHVSLDVGLDKARVVADAAAIPCVSGAVYRIPLRLDVNDHPTLDLELDVAAADPPLRLSGGILALKGVGRDDPERKVTFELLAARRGPPGGEIEP